MLRIGEGLVPTAYLLWSLEDTSIVFIFLFFIRKSMIVKHFSRFFN